MQFVSEPAAPSYAVSARRPGSSRAVVPALAFAGVTAALMQSLVIPLIAEFPSIFHTSASNASWVITATLLTASVAIPVTGRLGDLYGTRRVILFCATALVVGSLICAAASSLEAMILGRALQGSGLGLISLGMSTMREVVPAERLGSAIAFMSASLGFGSALGLPFAAFVIEHGSWRLMFAISAATAAVATLGLLFFVPSAPGHAMGRFDVSGAIGLGAGLVCFLLPVSKGADWGWSDPLTIVLLAASPVILLAWGAFELRSPHPLIDLRVAARPAVLLTNANSLTMGFAMYAISLVAPQLLQMPTESGYGLGQSMLQMGLWMLPGGFAMMVGSQLGARVSHAYGPKVTLVLGSLIVAIGYLAALGLMGSPWGIMITVILTSGGIGTAYGAMPALIMGSVPRSETGAANSFNSVMRSTGTATAAAVTGVILANLTTTIGGVTFPSESGFQIGLAIGAAAGLLGAGIATAIPAKASLAAEEEIELPRTEQARVRTG